MSEQKPTPDSGTVITLTRAQWVQVKEYPHISSAKAAKKIQSSLRRSLNETIAIRCGDEYDEIAAIVSQLRSAAQAWLPAPLVAPEDFPTPWQVWDMSPDLAAVIGRNGKVVCSIDETDALRDFIIAAVNRATGTEGGEA